MIYKNAIPTNKWGEGEINEGMYKVLYFSSGFLGDGWRARSGKSERKEKKLEKNNRYVKQYS